MENMSDIRAEQAAAVRTFGARMKQARELCNMSQLTAAERLGYANSSKLSKVEIATDGNSVPTWLIVRASRVYEVSTDYLLGQTDEWEIGMRIPIEGEASEWLFKAFRKTSQREMLVLLELHKKMVVIESGLTKMHGAIGEVNAALERFRELHPNFETDMRGSARLVGAIERAIASANDAQMCMRKFKMECTLAASSDFNQVAA